MSDGVKKINEYLIKDGRTLVLTSFISDTSKLPEGTIYINPLSGALQYIQMNTDGSKTWEHFDMSDLFLDGTFNTNLLVDNSIHGEKLEDLSISSGKLADNSVTTSKIADKSVTNSKFNLNTIDADKLLDSSISTSKIHNSAITTLLIADNAVTTSKVASKVITLEKMADDSVDTSSLLDLSVNTSKVADAAITTAKIADGSITSVKVAVKGIATTNIDNLAITTEKMADGAVQGKKIPDFGIKDNHIETIDGYKILDNTILSSKIKNNAITTNLIADGNITFIKLDSSTKSLINNSIKIQDSILIDNVEHYNTGLISGNIVMKMTDGTKSNLTVNGDIVATGDVTGARVFNPYFADIAEAYIPVCELNPGDPVALCEEGGLKVTKLDETNTGRFLGFVSNEYAMLFGADKKDVESGRMIPICLTGRIKCNLGTDVSGKVGNYINVFNVNGERVTFVTTNYKTEYSFGRLLENKTHEQTTVLCQLWP